MKAPIEIELKPFPVPNYAIADNDLEARSAGCENQAFPLSYLSPETLEQMCDDFRAEVFKKAGKQRPAREMAASKCPRCDGTVRVVK